MEETKIKYSLGTLKLDMYFKNEIFIDEKF